jgi:hypothetical protein
VEGNLEIVRRLLKEGANIEAEGRDKSTPLILGKYSNNEF